MTFELWLPPSLPQLSPQVQLERSSIPCGCGQEDNVHSLASQTNVALSFTGRGRPLAFLILSNSKMKSLSCLLLQLRSWGNLFFQLLLSPHWTKALPQMQKIKNAGILTTLSSARMQILYGERQGKNMENYCNTQHLERKLNFLF